MALSSIFQLDIKNDLARGIRYSNAVQQFYESGFYGLSADQAFHRLANDPYFRETYFNYYPDASEDDFINSARSTARIYEVITKLRRERKVTPEEMDRPCSSRAA